MVSTTAAGRLRRGGAPPHFMTQNSSHKESLGAIILRATSFKSQVILLLPSPADRHIHHGSIGGGPPLTNMTYNSFWDQKAALFDGDRDLAEAEMSLPCDNLWYWYSPNVTSKVRSVSF